MIFAVRLSFDRWLTRHLDTDAQSPFLSQPSLEIDASDGDFVLHLGDVVDGGRDRRLPLTLSAVMIS